jgi:hypothetical protein
VKSAILVLVVASASFAQFKISFSLQGSSPPQTASQRQTTAADTLGLSARGVRAVLGEPQKSTKLAMLLSAVIPGAGQIYVERYWTVPLVWGFGYYFYRSMDRQGDLYQQYRESYLQSIRTDTVNHPAVGNSNLREIRDFYHDERDRFAIYLGLTYLLNIVDAYVGASLFGFDVSEDLGGNAKLNFRIPINLPPERKQ